MNSQAPITTEEAPSPEAYRQSAQSLARLIRWVMLGQMVFGWACLVLSMFFYWQGGSYLLIISLANVAAGFPVICRLAIFEIERNIVNFQKAAAQGQPTPQLDAAFADLKRLRERWIGGLIGEFVLSMSLALGGIVAHQAESPWRLAPTALLWLLGLICLLAFTRDAFRLARSLPNDG